MFTSKIRGLYRSRILILLWLHRFIAVHAQNVYYLGCPHAVTAAGANIFDAVGVWAAAACWLACRVPCAFAARCAATLDAVHVDVIPSLLQNELTKGFRWFCYAPTDARVIADFQVAGFGNCLKFLIVVCAAPATILYTILHIVNMYALVEF